MKGGNVVDVLEKTYREMEHTRDDFCSWTLGVAVEGRNDMLAVSMAGDEELHNMALGVKHTHIALVCFYMASTTTHYLCGEMDSHYDVNTVVGQMRGYDV